MKNYKLFGASLLSGILLWAAWPLSPLTFLIFIALIPLLYLADVVVNKRLFFLLAFITLLVWNVLATWWIWNSTDVGSIAAFIANSLVMYLPWWGYRVAKRKFGQGTGYVALVLFWMSFEYIHLNWQLSWPWLTLGNVFASNPDWVQWYEYTGTSGGTLWVLLVNILVYRLLVKYVGTQHQKIAIVKLVPAAVTLIVPFVISIIVKPGDIPATQAVNGPVPNVVIVQPNIDPYGKIDQGTVGEQVIRLLKLTNSQLDSSTKLVLWPETAMSGEGLFDEEVYHFPAYQPIFQQVQRLPGVTLVTGIEVLKNYGPEKKTVTARAYGNGAGYYDAYNASIAIKAGVPPAYYYKSKLVPGVETLPGFLRWMAPVFEKFGGTTGGYGVQDEASVFRQPGQPYVVAPIICYESIYGEYVSTYVKKGANLLTIMTNDGWWGNTPGHKQHLQYARLRAIETRRWVARSANTGISAVIDEKGNIKETRPWAEAAVLKYSIPMLTGQTFYVRYGDLLSKTALALGAAMLAWLLFSMAKTKWGR